MTSRVLYLVGGAPRVGKSVLAQRLLSTEGIPWLPTDVVRTVLRRVVPEIDAVDRDPVDAARLAQVMYPHIEQAAEVCTEEADRFLIEGFELSPSYPARLEAALKGMTVRACFFGHGNLSAADLAAYHGPKPQHERETPREELDEAAAWIRLRSRELRDECRNERMPYVDVGEVGFESAMRQGGGTISSGAPGGSLNENPWVAARHGSPHWRSALGQPGRVRAAPAACARHAAAGPGSRPYMRRPRSTPSRRRLRPRTIRPVRTSYADRCQGQTCRPCSSRAPLARSAPDAGTGVTPRRTPNPTLPTE